jgi:hypothetical protein
MICLGPPGPNSAVDLSSALGVASAVAEVTPGNAMHAALGWVPGSAVGGGACTAVGHISAVVYAPLSSCCRSGASSKEDRRSNLGCRFRPASEGELLLACRCTWPVTRTGEFVLTCASGLCERAGLQRLVGDDCIVYVASGCVGGEKGAAAYSDALAGSTDCGCRLLHQLEMSSLEESWRMLGTARMLGMASSKSL